MFSYDERMKAVKLYIQYALSAAKVIRELGYPRNRAYADKLVQRI